MPCYRSGPRLSRNWDMAGGFELANTPSDDDAVDFVCETSVGGMEYEH